ncbi:MAG: AMP-binding protein [Proteobacteria bacterium]|nr:AMP-binding protein [Pseudomonadota bacterium]
MIQDKSLSSCPQGGLWRAFLLAGETHGWSRAVIEDMSEQVWTYRDLYSRAISLRTLWQSQPKNTPIGFLLPSHPATLSALFAAWSEHHVAAVLNITAGVAGIQAACQVVGLTLVVSSRNFLEAVNAQALPSALPEVQWLFIEDIEQQPELTEVDMVITETILPDDEAVVLFTSGSEGSPKGVALSHNNLFINIEQTCAQLDFLSNDRFFIALPLFHSFGLTVGCLLPLLKGYYVVLYPNPLLVKQIPKAIKAKQCTVLFGSSSFFSQWGRSADDDDMASLRYVIAGAEKLQPTVRTYWQNRFSIPILEGYGVTETAPVIAVNTLENNKIGSVGQLIPMMQAAFSPVDGLAVGGRLHVSGPNVMLGYYLAEAPKRLSPVPSLLGAPWYDTGDLACMNDDDTLTILGRQKRFAKVGGEMVSLAATESLAQHLDPEGQHAAAAVADPQRGERIVLLTTNPHLSRSLLAEVAKQQQLPEIVLPRAFMVVEKLPVLASGKLDLAALASLAMQA